MCIRDSLDIEIKAEKAVKEILRRTSVELEDLLIDEQVDFLEVRQTTESVIVEMEPEKKVNLDGGAIALGHPLGATGARITGKAAQLLQRENKKYALSTQCIGLGQGIATVLESIN